MYPFPPEQSETTLLQTTRGHVAIINTLENVEEIETFEKENEQEMPYPVRKTFFEAFTLSLLSRFFRLRQWTTRNDPGSVRARRRHRSWSMKPKIEDGLDVS